MAVANAFDIFTQDLADGKHDFQAAGDEIKAFLTDVQPLATHTAYDGVTGTTGPAEIAPGNGYNAGGYDTQNTRDANVSGKTLVKCTDITIAASGGAIAQFQWIVFYNNTDAGKPLINWYDFGSKQNLADGDSRTVQFDGTNGWLDLDNV